MLGMSKQHYQPASLIGAFSLDTTRSLRERTVWVRRRGVPHAFRERAQNLAYEHNLYTLSGELGYRLDPATVDRLWNVYEPDLPAAIPALVDSASPSLGARLWLKCLVPYVTGLFLRGREFNHRFEARSPISQMRDYYGPTGFADNTNLARLMEMQRLLFPVATAEWTIIHCASAAVTSDTGYCLMQHHADGAVGYAIPLRPDAVLVLRRGYRHVQLRWDGDQWIVDGIQHAISSAPDVANLNRAIAGTAVEIFGPTQQLVETSAQAWDKYHIAPAHAPGPGWLVEDPRRLRQQEMLWFKALSLIAQPPSDGSPSVLRMR
jgi:hypothetical protein